ncbi:aminotransferase class V-fold PLP-dependent enzyme [bacterium]|nr:aminotransferase class V-fold PLP-dependent enzyme [bacterium]
MKEFGFNTKAIHGISSKPDANRAIRYPVYSGVAFDFETAEDIEEAFSGRKPAFAYSRTANPTVDALEKKINALEGGHGTIAFSSGMAATSNALLNLLETGDNLIASCFLFGNTYSLLKHTLPSLGIQTRFVDITQPETINQVIDEKTKLIFLETISNPQMIVPDINRLAEIAHAKGLVVVVDGTVTTPYLFEAKKFGVDIVIHSTTKFISGGATSVGGVLVDLGNCDWKNFSSLEKYHGMNKDAFLARLRKEVYRNMGACMSPQAAYLQSLGLETLSLRVDKSCQNTQVVAEYLEQKKSVMKVNYPGLASSPFFECAKKQFKGKFGGILSFELKDKKTCFQVINKLKLIRRATNLNDNSSLIIHPASTIYTEYSHEEKIEMGVTEGLIRLSVGIEDVDDLIFDLDQALAVIE